MSRLSIVIPALDEAENVSDLLDDLVPLRAQGHEVVLVDGGSQDQTREIARPRVDSVIETARGRAIQMNAGARATSGDILWFLHADTRIPAEAAGGILDICTKDGSHWGRFDVRLSGSHWLLRMVERMMNWRSGITGIASGDQGIFVTRELFESVSGFPEIPLMEDIAMSRALRSLAPAARIRSPRLQTSSRRWEQHGIISTIVLMWRLRLGYAFGAAPHELAKRYP